MGSTTAVTGVVIVVAVAVLLRAALPARSDIPEHLIGHPVEYTRGLISEENAVELKKLVHEMKDFPSNIAADLKTGGWKVKHPHIGEAMPIVVGTDPVTGNATYTCEHDFMVPNGDRTECSLPQRIDVGKHFVYTGGVDGQRENFQSFIQRVTSFGRYYMGQEALETKLPPLVLKLFQEHSFQSAAKKICPADKQHLDPFQFNVIMQIPGQTVASHIDAPYFWGADRLDFPQWLLAVMVFSGLFRQSFIDQVQVVGYLSDISPPPGATQAQKDAIGGEFIYYQTNDGGRYTKETAEYRAGSTVDGSKLVHASRIYRPDVQVPAMSKDKHSELRHRSGSDWDLTVDGETVASYTDKELRVSIVYRARCFKDAAELQRYRTYPADKRMTLQTVLDALKADLVSKHVLSRTRAKTIGALDLAMTLLGHYIKYPFPSADERPLMPWNYCLLSKKLSFLPDVC